MSLALLLGHPGALAWLFVPALILWLARRAQRPPEVAIGTFALWPHEEELRGMRARARARVPAWAWWAAGAALLAVLAALSIRGVPARAARTWHVLVDLSPSMHLAHGRTTRLETALEAAQELLASELAPADRVRWSAAGRATLELAPLERPRADWLAPDAGSAREPAFDEYDRPGTLWVTDRAPERAPEFAWLCASGGPAVPGPIAGDGASRVELDAAGIPRTVAAPSAAGVLLRGDLPPVLARAARAWAEARGYVLGGHADQAALVLESAGDGPARSLTLGAAGWRARATASAGTLAPDEVAPWRGSTDEDGELAVLAGRPGRMRVFLRTLDEPEGDPAAFALACGQLFDALARPREEVVPLEERADAGAAKTTRGAPPFAARQVGEAGSRHDAVLAGLAALCALLAARARQRAVGPSGM